MFPSLMRLSFDQTATSFSGNPVILRAVSKRMVSFQRRKGREKVIKTGPERAQRQVVFFSADEAALSCEQSCDLEPRRPIDDGR